MKKPSELTLWVDSADAGESMVYHVGTHAYGDIGREAMDLHDAGLIAPVRRRQPGTNNFEYIAQRTKMRRKP